MRFLSSNWIYPLNTAPIHEGVICLSDKGKIIDVLQDRTHVPIENLEIYHGILAPGFINAHCHLELSYLHKRINPKEGLLNFIKDVQRLRSFQVDDIMQAISDAESDMIKNGIVGVGDICNTNYTIDQKKKQNLQYYNFIEAFEIKEHCVSNKIYEAKGLKSEFRDLNLSATIVPHAPYSVVPSLMKAISNEFDLNDKLISIHMQESELENILFSKKTGSLMQWLKSLEACSSIWKDRKRSFDILHELSDKEVLMVHNTFSKKEDIVDCYYCTCPKANQYIEDGLPDYSIFNNSKLCVGTDSLASNNSLSVFEELLVIKENTDFKIETLLKIGCKNGAEALGFETLGTFAKGKKPGVNLIDLEFTKFKQVIR